MDSLPITMTAKIVECHDPPAVQLIIDNPFSEKDRDLVNGVFTTTSKINVFGYDILVTVHQLGGGIGVEVINLKVEPLHCEYPWDGLINGVSSTLFYVAGYSVGLSYFRLRGVLLHREGTLT